MGKFQKYVPGQIDKESQYKNQLNDLEHFIFKPHKDGIKSMTKDEIEEYINLGEEKLIKAKIDGKTIAVYQETRRFLQENLENILNDLKNNEDEKSQHKEKKKGEEENER